VWRLTDFHFFRGCIAFLMRAIPVQQGKAMSKQIIFIQVHGSPTIVEAEISAVPTVGELHDLLADRAIEIVAETFIFIDEAEQPTHGQRGEPVHGLKHGGRVHVTRCHGIKTTVHFLEKTAEHEFPPGARVRAVKEWAAHTFKLSPKDAAEHVLQLCNSADRPPSDTPLHQLVHGHSCALCFDLVPEKRVEG
jgi:hypothetical protein